MPRLETLVTRQLAPGRKGWQKLSFEYFTFHKQNNWAPSPRRLCCNIMQSLAFSPHRQTVPKVVYLQTSISQKSFSGFSDLSKLFSSWRLRLEFGSQLEGDFPFLFGVECFRFLFCLCSSHICTSTVVDPPKKLCCSIFRKKQKTNLYWNENLVAKMLLFPLWFDLEELCKSEVDHHLKGGRRGPRKGDNITS